MRCLLLVGVLMITLIALGCDTSGDVEERLEFHDPTLQSSLIAELDAQGISYRLDESGRIWYRASERARFDSAVRFVLQRDAIPETAVSYSDPKAARLLMQLLDRDSIPYHVRKENDRSWIVWSKEQDSRVAPLKVVVEKRIVDGEL